jgi:uncharacterized protein YukJ
MAHDPAGTEGRRGYLRILHAIVLQRWRYIGVKGSMPVERYGVVIGRMRRRTLDRNADRPHYHLLLEAGDEFFHIAVNVRSAVDRAELLYLIDDRLEHPHAEIWKALRPGSTPLAPTPDSGAIDFIRGQIVDRRDFRIAHRARRGEGGLPDLLDLHVNRAMNAPDVLTYAFGARWGPKPGEIDRTFRDQPIEPSDGIHNVHMNQGSQEAHDPGDGRHADESGPWQDGALLIHDTRHDDWTGIFLAFQSQQWHSDDQTGQPALPPGRTGDWNRPSGEEPDFRVRIVAAMVNPGGPAPEAECVTLLNTTAETISLAGWTVINGDRRATRLSGTIPPRASLVVELSPDAPLGNRGGTIGLLDDRGLKVDGVAYTRRQAEREGELITFRR